MGRTDRSIDIEEVRKAYDRLGELLGLDPEDDDSPVAVVPSQPPKKKPPAPSAKPAPTRARTKLITQKDIEDMPLSEMLKNVNSFGEGAFYNGGYTANCLANLYVATGDSSYIGRFIDWFTPVRQSASRIMKRNGSGGCGTGGPKRENGATQTSYRQWQKCPSVKAQRQFAFGVQRFIYLTLKTNVGAKHREELEGIHKFVRRNIIERWLTNGGSLNKSVLSLADAAHKKKFVNRRNPGYFGSQVILGIGTCLYNDLCNKMFRLKAEPWEEAADYKSAWEKFVGSTIVTDDGCLLWDTVDTPSANTNINDWAGWGERGEHKAPETSHAWRYVVVAQQMHDLGLLPRDFMVALGNTLNKRIFLPADYATPDGKHKGKEAGTIQTANYIDGDNSWIRRSNRGYYTENKSNASMGGEIATGWALAALYNESARRKVFELLKESRIYRGPNDARHHGTWYRHQSAFGQCGLTGWLAWIDSQ